MRFYWWLALAALTLAATGAEARPRDDVMSRAFRCAAISDTRQWLDCYYGAAQPVRAALGLTPAPQAAARPLPVAPMPAQPGFGIPAKAAPAMESDRVTARMTSYSFNRYGIFTVTLDNGQVWHQLSGDTNDAHWTKPASNYVVSITHGFFGSFNLSVKGLAGLYKVRRSQ
jgi:hypothetical protein